MTKRRVEIRTRGRGEAYMFYLPRIPFRKPVRSAFRSFILKNPLPRAHQIFYMYKPRVL